MSNEREELETIKKSMFRDAMNDNWKEIVKVFKDNPWAQDAMITRSGDTALHVAVSEGKVAIVRELVKEIPKENVTKVLSAKNERRNTPLHLAAALGTVATCKCIAEKDPQLIGARNYDGETPLFLAALHGQKKAFLCLHYLSPPGDGINYCRRNDGDTILHCAIFGEYFGLAYQIINLYEKLVDWKNEIGHTPLHVLATKPSAFKSGSLLGWYDRIIYHCIFVDPLVPETLTDEDYIEDSVEEHSSKYPDNYKTCVNFIWLLKNTFFVLGPGKKSNGHQADVEKSNQASQDRGRDGNQVNVRQRKSSQLIPSNYETCFSFFKLVMKALLIVLGLGFRKIQEIQDKKEKHTWATQIMNVLVGHTSEWEYDDGWRPEGSQPKKDGETTAYDVPGQIRPEENTSTQPESSDTKTKNNTHENNKEKEKKATDGRREGKRETPILIAAKTGVIEMVEAILNKFPVAIQDSNSHKKNIVLLAVENRQPDIYQLLLNRNVPKESVFRKLDDQGNSALHLAATLGRYRPRLTPGAALHMQWEIKWYKFVKNSMPPQYFVRYNKNYETPKEVFTRTHKDLTKDGGQWLTNTSQSCSVVAALIATVAFATSSTVPGGVRQDIGTPTLEGQVPFDIFAISSLIALCFSVTSLIMFLAILTSRYQEKDFAKDLPNKLILGLSSLFVSIAAMLISFCSGHFFVVKDKLKYAAYPVYAVTCLPVTFFAVAQFPLYVDLIRFTFKKVPLRRSK